MYVLKQGLPLVPHVHVRTYKIHMYLNVCTIIVLATQFICLKMKQPKPVSTSLVRINKQTAKLEHQQERDRRTETAHGPYSMAGGLPQCQVKNDSESAFHLFMASPLRNPWCAGQMLAVMCDCLLDNFS